MPKSLVKPYEEKRQEELRQFLVNWLICDSHPLNIV